MAAAALQRPSRGRPLAPPATAAQLSEARPTHRPSGPRPQNRSPLTVRRSGRARGQPRRSGSHRTGAGGGPRGQPRGSQQPRSPTGPRVREAPPTALPRPASAPRGTRRWLPRPAASPPRPLRQREQGRQETGSRTAGPLPTGTGSMRARGTAGFRGRPGRAPSSPQPRRRRPGPD